MYFVHGLVIWCLTIDTYSVGFGIAYSTLMGNAKA